MLTLVDVFVAPTYFLIFIMVGQLLSKKATKDKELQGYFLNGLILKLIGAIFLGLVYEFYYLGGDTINYFSDCRNLNRIFWENPLVGLRLIFGPANVIDKSILYYSNQIFFFADPPSYFVPRVGAILSFFSFTSYMGISLWFALISFSGAWAMFKTFLRFFPTMKKQIAYSVFYMPSIFFWGSGLLKDTITFAALGWFFYGLSEFFIFKERKATKVFTILVSATTITIVKVYILMCFVPAVTVFLFLTFNQNIKSRITKALIAPILVGISIFFGLFAAENLAKTNEKYKLNNLANQAKVSSEWLERVSRDQGGSVYTLGKIDNNVGSLIEKFPAAVNVTLFRPYIWESKNINMLISALESTFILVFTIIVIFKLGFFTLFQVTKSNPILFFMLIFTIVFAFAIGISTNNFGTLVRYKIPILPFFMMYLFLTFEMAKILKKSKSRLSYANV